MAVTEPATLRTFSSRLLAVTTTSSSWPTASFPAEAADAAAGARVTVLPPSLDEAARPEPSSIRASAFSAVYSPWTRRVTTPRSTSAGAKICTPVWRA